MAMAMSSAKAAGAPPTAMPAATRAPRIRDLICVSSLEGSGLLAGRGRGSSHASNAPSGRRHRPAAACPSGEQVRTGPPTQLV
ncbi:hypothetical protein FDP22_22340 (plasmid) [Paroceanicella profunda]|uniref:Uncharacterized protein n=1 Tax=Paroceanicella profunda TaxID=2579971 RepID=A0A5B8G686_9RHOB|nr:hypothetical protein FDP22_22340 [Paroceanicella profunda]